jgi:hypothetical protein
MMLQDALGALEGKSALGDEDALALRRVLYGEMTSVTREEIEALFRLNAAAESLSSGWRQLFIEAATDLIVRQSHPVGYVDEAAGDWLIKLVQTHTIKGDEIELLVHILEEASETPERFSAFVLDVVKRFAIWSLKRLGRLDHVVVEKLRRVVFAKGGDKDVAVTRSEAEALFEVNAAARGIPADPAWKDFFVRAVAASVLSAPIWKPDAAAEAQEESWLADPKQLLVFPWSPRDAFTEKLVRDGQHDLLQPMNDGARDLLHGNLSGLRQQVHDFCKVLFDDPLTALADRETADEATLAEADALTDDEADWLLARIGACGPVDENEAALIDFILANASSAPTKLKAGLRELGRQVA